MRIRTFAASVAVATLATVPLAGVAIAQPDRDCDDFATQAEAQAALDSRVGDPERLDADDDGYACESRFGEPTGDSDDEGDDEGQVSVVPEGGVETGDGSGGGAPAIAVLVAAALAGSAAVAGRRVAGRAR